MSQSRHSLLALAVVGSLALTACSSGNAAPESGTAAQSAQTQSGSAEAPTTATIEDNFGSHTIDVPPKSVVSVDNRTFAVLAQWDVDLSAAAVSLIPSTVTKYHEDNIPDIGTHNEPNLEIIAAAQPDVVINGQRFQKYQEDIQKLVPDATVLNLEPRDGEPLDSELKRQVTELGKVFNKQADAEQLTKDFDDALARAKAAYDPSQTVMGLNVSGGNIGYVAPSVGRFWGPIFDMIGMTPALKVDGASENHKGDDISVEAIAQAKPDWLVVMDRDAAITKDGKEYTPAKTVIEDNAVLADIPAITSGHVVFAPNDTYTNESILTYTAVLNDLADQFEQAKSAQ